MLFAPIALEYTWLSLLVVAMAGCSRGVTREVEARGTESDSNTMKCPFCRVDNDRVTDSRASEDGFAIRRRRECVNCHRRYTTYERIEEQAIKVVKKDGVRVPYERDKIKRGLEKACWKRPIRDEQIEAVVAAIEADVFANFDTEVDSRYLGELAMQHLRQLDQVAFVRFASVYREFEDVRDFVEELQPMLEKTDRAP
jgi:transcriptional repressor NrdR